MSDEAAIELLRTTNKYMQDIAAELGMSCNSVRKLNRTLGIRRPAAEPPAPDHHDVNLEAAVSLAVSGHSTGTIVRMLGASPVTVYTARNKYREQLDEAEKGASEVYIYALACPIAKQAFYVGSAVEPWKRYAQHLANPYSQSMADWIERLDAIGKTPKLKILAHLWTKDRFAVERLWIDALLEAGHPLMNREGQ